MASVNDNLFTTRFGRVRTRFTGVGLAGLVFEDEPEELVEQSVGDAAGEVWHREVETARERRRGRALGDSAAHEAFLEWVSTFGHMDAAAKWRSLDLEGTDFQKSVWRALLEIPFGAHRSYGQIAADLGRPDASRAVGSAVGANPVSLLVPCHRVLPATGKPGNYRWGAARKRALLDAEQESGSDLCSLLQ